MQTQSKEIEYAHYGQDYYHDIIIESIIICIIIAPEITFRPNQLFNTAARLPAAVMIHLGNGE